MYSTVKWMVIEESGLANGAVVPNLKPRTKYEVEVAAKTSAGVGEFVRRSAITVEKPGWCFCVINSADQNSY